VRWVLSALLIAASGALLFANLGHYAFWDDEADTAIYAHGIWETGDTSAVVGKNICAYRFGGLLVDLKNRSTPPGQYLVVAPFYGLTGFDTFWLRFPMALCGLACVLIVVRWLWRAEASLAFWLVFSVALLGNVSFFLYLRQCRYYALTMLASLVIVYLYLNFRGWRSLVGILLASMVLLASQYLNYFALYAGLAVDYFLWQRKVRPVNLKQACALFLPQIVLAIPLIYLWNPFGKAAFFDKPGGNWLIDRFVLLAWHLRELHGCEIASAFILIAGFVVAWRRHDVWLLRGLTAIGAYVLATVLATPQSIRMTNMADIRYLAPLILLCVWATARSTLDLTRGRIALALPLAGVACLTTVLFFPWFPWIWRSTLWEFVGELRDQRPTSIGVTADWINQHVPSGSSVCVVDGFHAYPLMLRAPDVYYAWQLQWPPEPQFRGMSAINFLGQVPVDYFIAFGPGRKNAEAFMKSMSPSAGHYELETTLDIDADDHIRPEMYSHLFKPVDNLDTKNEAVYIYRRVPLS
jgi:hypothetical protein